LFEAKRTGENHRAGTRFRQRGKARGAEAFNRRLEKIAAGQHSGERRQIPAKLEYKILGGDKLGNRPIHGLNVSLAPV
jgi:hypothetical protein